MSLYLDKDGNNEHTHSEVKGKWKSVNITSEMEVRVQTACGPYKYTFLHVVHYNQLFIELWLYWVFFVEQESTRTNTLYLVLRDHICTYMLVTI